MFTFLIWDDQLQYYLHPKMNIFIYVTTVVFFVIGFLLIVVWRKIVADTLSLSTLSVPILLFLFFPSTGVYEQFGYSKGVVVGDGLVLYSDTKTVSEEIRFSMGMHEAPAKIGARQKEGARDYSKKIGKLIVNTDNYHKVIQEIVRDPAQYYGYTMSIEGAIMKSNQLPEDALIISRILITCCLADATIIGLLASHADKDAFLKGVWYQMQGEIDLIEKENILYPILRIKEYAETSIPRKPYLYR